MGFEFQNRAFIVSVEQMGLQSGIRGFIADDLFIVVVSLIYFVGDDGSERAL